MSDEDRVMNAIRQNGGSSYGVNIYNYLSGTMSMGRIYGALWALESKGKIKAQVVYGSKKRGFHDKRIYTIV